MRVMRAVEASPRAAAHDRRIEASTKPSAQHFGQDARPRSPPWAGSRPTCSAWTARSRAGAAARAGAHGRDVGGIRSRLLQCLPCGRRQSASADHFRRDEADELERAEAFGAEILRLCVEVGGVLTGEHGVGVEKRDLMPTHVRRNRSCAAAASQMRLRSGGLLNPGKVFPQLPAAPNWVGCMSTAVRRASPSCHVLNRGARHVGVPCHGCEASERCRNLGGGRAATP